MKETREIIRHLSEVFTQMEKPISPEVVQNVLEPILEDCESPLHGENQKEKIIKLNNLVSLIRKYGLNNDK